MSVPDGTDAQADWEVTPEGLYIATRHFLVRRGYCCANRCRNCPYVNWCDNAAWRPAPAEAIRSTHVSPKAIAGTRAALSRHEQALDASGDADQEYHCAMIEHYLLLLERWH